jgi:hypothetical protein
MISIGMVFAIVIVIVIITTITAAVSIVLENGIILMRATPKWSKIQSVILVTEALMQVSHMYVAFQKHLQLQQQKKNPLGQNHSW